MIRNYKETDWSKYLDYSAKVEECELVTRGFELFDAAMEKATPEQTKRIAKLRLIPEFAHSYALYEVYGSNALKDNVINLLYDFFKTDAGILNYLSGKRFTVKKLSYCNSRFSP